MMGIMQLVVFLFGFSTSLVPLLHRTFTYGKGPENFGISGVEKGEPVGPYSFAIGGPINSIYIPDPINKDIKIVSLSGDIERSIPFKGYFDDIRVDREGNIYILDRMGQRILVLNEKGKSETEYKLDYETVKYPCKLNFKNDKIFIKQENQTLMDALTKSILPEQYEVSIKNERLDIFEHKNGVIKQITSFEINGIVSAEFLGTDRNNHIYVQIETRKEPVGVNLLVLKFSPDGKLIGEYKIPHNDYFVWTARLLDIDEEGNLYQVLPAEDRLEINIWKTE